MAKQQEAPKEFQPNMAKLTPEQQRVAEYVKTAKDKPPELEIGKDHFTRIEMEVPQEVIKGAEYKYAWLPIDGLEAYVNGGSKWEIVTRSNHFHAPQRLFGQDGAITYKGQNILGFCFRSVVDAEEKAIVEEYNRKTDQITEPQDSVKEGEVARLGDPKSAGKAVQTADLPESEPDYADPK